jgi:hypothetical protein
MIDINTEWLEGLGVQAAKKADMDKLVARAEGELQVRIGNILIEDFTDEQIDEFEGISDEDEKLAWLEKAYPTYKKVVKAEYDAMSKEIKKASDKIALIEGWK